MKTDKYNPYPLISDYAPCGCKSGKQYRQCCRMSPKANKVMDQIRNRNDMIEVIVEGFGKRLVLAVSNNIDSDKHLPTNTATEGLYYFLNGELINKVAGIDPMKIVGMSVLSIINTTFSQYPNRTVAQIKSVEISLSKNFIGMLQTEIKYSWRA